MQVEDAFCCTSFAKFINIRTVRAYRLRLCSFVAAIVDSDSGPGHFTISPMQRLTIADTQLGGGGDASVIVGCEVVLSASEFERLSGRGAL